MWRSTTARNISTKLLPLRGSNPNPNPNFNPFLFASTLLSNPNPFPHEKTIGAIVTSHLHSSANPWRREAAGFSSSSTPIATATPAVFGSVGAVSRKAVDLSTVLRHYGRCYWELSKAKLSMLVVATSGAGFVLGSGHVIDFAGLCCTCAGTMMVAASANSLNQVFEVKNDAKMKRTMLRPLPSRRLSVPHAVIWASSVGIAGTTLLAWQANYLAASLAACNLGLYAFVYTPLKQIHPANTWVGAVVGAIPPLLGWAAACGEISLNAMILPAALYFWQLPHFMALAYLCRNDYIAGGFRMFSFADASGWRTALVSLRNCLYLLPLGFLAYDWGLTSEWFTLESSLLTLFMTAAAMSFVRNRTRENARRMFHGSLLYLPIFMSGILLRRLPNDREEPILASLNVAEDSTTCISETQRPSVEDSRRPGSRQTRDLMHGQSRPPVAFASVAPFPFLPAPLCVSPDF